MTSWKTTLGGILATAGLGLASGTGTTHLIGVILQAGGMLLIGSTARDNSVTSEQAGAK